LEAGAGTVVLREGVRLGPPHTIGQYQVTLWLSDAPTEAAAPAPPAGVEPTRLTFEIVE
jgi:hypothetical protein